MKLFNKEELLVNGFVGFKTIEELSTSKSLIPKQNGVYLILNFEKEIRFLEQGTGGYHKGKGSNVEVKILQKKWVGDTNVVYIGKATDLQKRLNQYFRFGNGKNVGHYGGRYIWQLENSKNLMVCWKTVEGVSQEVEKGLISLFVSRFNKLPFANINR